MNISEIKPKFCKIILMVPWHIQTSVKTLHVLRKTSYHQIIHLQNFQGFH